jgi:hypothetical protein
MNTLIAILISIWIACVAFAIAANSIQIQYLEERIEKLEEEK